MLSRLYIENIAVIEKTEIDFTKGFNVLTGETGAGKSIVIDAISAVLGRRTSRELVRTGADSAFVSATFTDVGETTKEALKKLAIPIEDELILEREFTLSGKNICKINSRPASISVLREISRFLINIHGQHESYELMSPDLHMGYIDSYGGHSDILKEYTEVYAEYKDVCRVLNQKNSDERDRLRRADLLAFQIDELESAEIRAGEFSELSEERNILANAQKLRELLSTASYYLKGDSGEFPGAVSLLSNACDEVSSAALVMDSVKTLSERLGSCYYDLEDISSELNSLAESIDDNPYRLEEIEMRLDLLSRLMKKYADSEEELLAYLESIKSELSAIESFEEDREKLLLMQSELYEKSMRIAVKLSEARRETSEKFSREVMKRMRLLDMPSAVVSVSQITGDLTDSGIDTLEFMVSTNAGEPVKPVSKVASGGELSRMMLSIKTVLSEKEPTDTLIFDEVDSGISGSAALRVGEALRDVSNSCQVLCVTHLPQIAAMAKSHYLIKKSEDNGRTYTKVIPLDTEGRVEELSRIIGGETVTETARSYAKELLKL
ncbi:MAG: DNA repair protein RecN [Oscillospiraceae bacterium]|nr:DNA repair protein RecN [Oscillospiraceae bacterium]